MIEAAAMKALENVGKFYMETTIAEEIEQATHRGEMYVWGGGDGSLSQAWSTVPYGNTITFMYDSSKLDYISAMGKHMTPDTQNSINAEKSYVSSKSYNQEKVTDMATLIDLGKGGNLFGKGKANPTHEATHFWDAFIDDWDLNKRRWIIDELEAVGLPVVYKGFV